MRRLISPECLAGIAGLCLLALPAAAQSDGGLYGGQPYTGGILPNVGSNTGDIRPQLERYFKTSVLPATAPAWVFEPSLGVDVGVTDNALRIAAPRRADVFTVLTPTFNLTGDTSRVQTNLSYSPQLQLYATQSSQTQVSQFFNGRSLVTLAPDALFLDLRGSVSQSSLTGNGFNNGITQSSATYNRQNQVQTTTFAVTPYAEHRFGGWGTARIGYSYVRTLQDTDNNRFNQNNQFNQVNVTGLGYGAIGNLTTQRERLSFASGENLGRFNDFAVLEAIQYSGSGNYGGSHRNQATNELGYALTRKITLLGGLGYQDILYAGQPAVRINEPTWNGGIRYTVNDDSAITILYGRRDGAASLSIDGQFAPTARTRLIGRYSTGITSDIEDAQNLLNTTSVGPTGLVTDSATGAPVGGGGAFGTQNGVYRVRRASLTALFLAERDSYSASVTQEDRTTLTSSSSFFTNGVIPAGTSSSSLSLSGGWQHQLSPDLSSAAYASYGVSNNSSQLTTGIGGEQTTISLTAALNKQFTETLSGSIRYTFTDQSGGRQADFSRLNLGNFNSGNYTENLLIAGLRKRF